MMEYWNDGTMVNQLDLFLYLFQPIIPVFQYSSPLNAH